METDIELMDVEFHITLDIGGEQGEPGPVGPAWITGFLGSHTLGNRITVNVASGNSFNLTVNDGGSQTYLLRCHTPFQLTSTLSLAAVLNCCDILMLQSGTVQAVVELSDDPGNTLENRDTGLFCPVPQYSSTFW